MTTPTPYHPHLWVPYGPSDEEICSLCGDFATPANADEPCPEPLADMPELPEISLPVPDAPELPEGWDDEQRQGVIERP